MNARPSFLLPGAPDPLLLPLLANTRQHRVKHWLGLWQDGFVSFEIGIRKRPQTTAWFSKFLSKTKPCLLGILSKRILSEPNPIPHFYKTRFWIITVFLSWMPTLISCYRERPPPPPPPPLLANTHYHRVKHRLGLWRDGFVSLKIGLWKKLQLTTWFSKFLWKVKLCLIETLSKQIWSEANPILYFSRNIFRIITMFTPM
jgi:hypothetical protein